MAEERIGKYRILGQIAAGSQGIVYRAFDPDSNRVVAVKVREKVGNMSLFMDDLEIYPSVTIEFLNYPIDDLSSEEILAVTDRIAYEP